MNLYSGRVMPVLMLIYSGVCWYFENSSSQACWLKGGIVTLMGFHSTRESPERVRRTNPPKTTRNATMMAKMKSHFITALFSVFGMLSLRNRNRWDYSMSKPARDLPSKREQDRGQLKRKNARHVHGGSFFFS